MSWSFFGFVWVFGKVLSLCFVEVFRGELGLIFFFFCLVVFFLCELVGIFSRGMFFFCVVMGVGWGGVVGERCGVFGLRSSFLSFGLLLFFIVRNLMLFWVLVLFWFDLGLENWVEIKFVILLFGLMLVMLYFMFVLSLFLM